ncbi:MAG: hypothetical protein IVW51_17350 [Thermaceae bacterium]|nr:hypothetical protein [Thermaceae bacterium]
MMRFLGLLSLAFLLPSCLILTDDGVSSTTITPPPASGAYTYVCRGGRLSVSYLGNNQVSIFYDGADRLLTLTRTTPRYTYSNGTYAWEASGRSGTLYVRGQVADSCSY